MNKYKDKSLMDKSVFIKYRRTIVKAKIKSFSGEIDG